MGGQRGFSPKTLDSIGKRLSLNNSELALLQALCAKQFSRSKKVKEAAAVQIKSARLYQVHIADKNVGLISDWYHIAILALMDSNEFESDVKWIAERLNIHEKVAEQAIERLIAVGAIQKQNENLISTGNLFVDPKDIPSSAVKEFHHQIIKKANDAIDIQGLDNRDVASLVMCFDKNKMKQAKERIKKFREEFEVEFAPEKKASEQEVYALGIQFFQLSKNNHGKGK